MVAEYCRQQQREGKRIFVDPIMGDDGVLYNGVSENTVGYMRQLCSVADIIMPNYTEAVFLSGKHKGIEEVTEQQAREIVDELRTLGAKSVIVTSIVVDGQSCVYGYDDGKGEYFKIPFEYVPVQFPGTGDIFPPPSWWEAYWAAMDCKNPQLFSMRTVRSPDTQEY